MPLDDIRLLSDLDESAPDGAVVSASELDDYIRQTRAFLKAFLSVAHDDTGALKEDLSNLTFADIGGQVESSQIAVRAIGPEHLDEKNSGAAAVLRENIADRAIGEDELADASVATAKIQDDSLSTAKYKDASITADKLAGNIPATKIDGLDGSSVTDGSITAAKHAVNAALSASVPGLPVITNSTTTARIAKIAGALSATLVDGSPPELRFAFLNALTTDTGVLAVLLEDDIHSAAMVIGTWKNCNGWSRIAGESVLTLVNHVETEDGLRLDNTGIYLLFYMVPVTGAPSSGTAYCECRVVDTDDVQLGRATEGVITSTVPGQHYMFGITSIAVTSAPQTIVVQVKVTDGSGGTWTLGAANRREAILAIIGIGEVGE